MGTNGCPQGHTGRPPSHSARPAPVTAHPDMRRRLTGPSPGGPSLQDRDRVAASPVQQVVRRRGDARPGHDDESAGEDRPCRAHVPVGRAWGSRATGNRVPRRPVARCHRGRHRAILSRPVSHPARTRARASARTRWAHQPRTRATPGPGSEASGARPRPAPDAGGAVGLVPRHATRRRRPRCGRRAPGPARRQAVRAARQDSSQREAPWPPGTWAATPRAGPAIGQGRPPSMPTHIVASYGGLPTLCPGRAWVQ